jgi:hypothetical protein
MLATRSRALCAVAVTLVLAGCSPLPPTKPVASVADIAGRWQGKGVARPSGAEIDVTMTIDRDGGYTAVIGPMTLAGTITLVDGTLRGKGKAAEGSATYSLHEGEGQRILYYRADDGLVRARLVPAP